LWGEKGEKGESPLKSIAYVIFKGENGGNFSPFRGISFKINNLRGESVFLKRGISLSALSALSASSSDLPILF
jgi:hypothetical protein